MRPAQRAVAPMTRAIRLPPARALLRAVARPTLSAHRLAPRLAPLRRGLAVSHRRRATAAEERRDIPRDNLSIVHGSTAEPLDERTLYQCWRDVVAANSDRTALLCSKEGKKEGVRWTFCDFDERIAALARGLYQAGLRKGDRLGVWIGNRSEHATAIWAAAKRASHRPTRT